MQQKTRLEISPANSPFFIEVERLAKKVIQKREKVIIAYKDYSYLGDLMSGKLSQFKVKLIVRSKAKRIFHIFEPNEPIVGEEFDLGLAITNLNQETYEDGYVSSILRYANADVQPSTLRFSFDTIHPNEEKELWLMDQTAFGYGPVLLHGFELVSEGKLVARGDYNPASTIPCHSFINLMDQPIDKDNPLIFNVASKEELYQKYSVIIALWASVIAIIVAIIGIFL